MLNKKEGNFAVDLIKLSFGSTLQEGHSKTDIEHIVVFFLGDLMESRHGIIVNKGDK
jgi:hypothetical protein